MKTTFLSIETLCEMRRIEKERNKRAAEKRKEKHKADAAKRKMKAMIKASSILTPATMSADMRLIFSTPWVVSHD